MAQVMNQHEYRDFQEAVLEFEQKFCQKSLSTKTLIHCVRRRCEIFSRCADHDFRGIVGNGYRSQCRLFTQWFRLANRMSHTSPRFTDFLSVMRALCSALERLDSQDVSDREKQVLLIDLSQRVSPFFLSGDFLVIDGNRQLRRIIKTFIVMSSVFLTSSLPAKVKCILSVRNCSANYIKSLANNTPDDVARFVRKLNCLPVRMSSRILSIFSNKSASAHSVKHKLSIPSHFEFCVSRDGVSLQARTFVSQIQLRFRQLTSCQDLPTGQLLVFVHGGGYVGPSAASIEDVFLKDWAAKLQGITILNVDVSLAPEKGFPVPLQELLDLFLWLTGEDVTSVREQLGFVPHDIVLSGDSSGGNLVAALTVALNDLRHAFPGSVRHMAKGLVLFVPKLSLDGKFFPSSLLAVIDPLINPMFQLKAGQAYVPFLKRKQDGSLVHLLDNKELPPNWLQDENYEPIKSWYLSPLDYEKMDELKDVTLYLLAYHFDPFLDESIALAHKWPGSVHLQMMEGVCHAGFYFRLLSSTASLASDKAVQMIRRSFARQTAL